MNIKSFKAISILTALCMIFSISSLAADELKINVGYWPGDLDPELEERFFLDDLITSAGLGQIDLAWDNKDTQTIYPLGLTYIVSKLGQGDLVLNANYMQYNPEYHYNGFTLGGSVTDATLVDYNISDYEYEAGYRFHLANNTFLLTPKVGYRVHNKSFTLDELTIGGTTVLKTLDSYFDAGTSGLYFGVDLQYYLTKEFSLVGSYIGASARWSGDATFNKLKIGVSGSAAALTYEEATSGYEMSIERFSIGVQYDLDKDWHFQLGLREEKLTQSYPGFYNLTFTSASGFTGFDATEFISDLIFYQQEITQTKGLIFVSATYDVDL